MKVKAGGESILVKDKGKGEVRLAFAQLNVVDHDGDYTVPGAFQAGQKVKVCQTGHAHEKRVAGAGVITGEEVLADGALWAVADVKFFLNTEAGREEYETVKALAEAGHNQEWSYGYDILDASPMQVDGQHVQGLKLLSVYEVSPVLRGAGIGTHTLAVKAKDGECEACGQALPKRATSDCCGKAPGDCECAIIDSDSPKADENLEACADCEKSPADCACEKDSDGKRRTTNAFIQWQLDRAKRLGALID